MSDTPRVPAITSREQLPEADRAHFDAIEASRGSVRGPFAVLLNSPDLAGRVADLGTFVRYESDLPAPLRELAILTTALEWECAYVWAIHEADAREAGVSDAAIDAVTSSSMEALDEPDADVVRYGRELLGDGEVSTATYQAVEDALGTRGTIELTATIGYYTVMSLVCNATGVLPDEPTAFR